MAGRVSNKKSDENSVTTAKKTAAKKTTAKKTTAKKTTAKKTTAKKTTAKKTTAKKTTAKKTTAKKTTAKKTTAKKTAAKKTAAKKTAAVDIFQQQNSISDIPFLPSKYRGRKVSEDELKLKSEFKIPADSPIPESYGTSYLTALPRDPQCVYVYWEIDDQKKKIADKDGKFVLRIEDITEGYGNSFDAEIELSANNWFIDVPQADRTYIVKLGFVKNNEFILLLTSNKVYVPSNIVSSTIVTVENKDIPQDVEINISYTPLGASENLVSKEENYKEGLTHPGFSIGASENLSSSSLQREN